MSLILFETILTECEKNCIILLTTPTIDQPKTHNVSLLSMAKSSYDTTLNYTTGSQLKWRDSAYFNPQICPAHLSFWKTEHSAEDKRLTSARGTAAELKVIKKHLLLLRAYCHFDHEVQTQFTLLVYYSISTVFRLFQRTTNYVWVQRLHPSFV